eukprot:TRINITY_DN917_c0_g1_i1.p1 TRINITY_DN917_c0_g1~~TRINITY_DN917_c0_g1_i1.p1  ORF type:complete len:470 (-),score=129.95 TRINITY_DN917_c0_g1_i1:126-1535(-)
MANWRRELSKDERMKHQIEFYFSDSNFPRDKYMRINSQQNDGWFPIELFMNFNRIREETDDVEYVKKICKTCSTTVMSEDEKFIKRKNEQMPDPDKIDSRTLVVSQLPCIEEEVTIDNLIEFFGQFGTVNCVRIRKTRFKEFFGGAFVEFADQKVHDDVLQKRVHWRTPGNRREERDPLEFENKKVYFKAIRNNPRVGKGKGRGKKLRPSGTGGPQRSANPPNTLVPSDSDAPIDAVTQNENALTPTKKRKADKITKKEWTPREFKSGCLVKVSNVEEEQNRTTMRGIMQTFGKVLGTWKKKKEDYWHLLYLSKETAKIALIEINSNEQDPWHVEIIKGNEEELFWEKVINRPPKIRKLNNGKGGNKGSGRGGGRGGRRGGGRGGRERRNSFGNDRRDRRNSFGNDRRDRRDQGFARRDPREHGRDPREHGRDPREHGRDPREHGRDPREHGRDPRDHKREQIERSKRP